MSSKAKKVSKQIAEQRLTTVVQVLTLMEEEAKKKNFFQRLAISTQYLFCGKIDVFFKAGKKREKVQDN